MTCSRHDTPPWKVGLTQSLQRIRRSRSASERRDAGTFGLTRNKVNMPSKKKTLHFMSSALVSSISVGILGFAMSTQWAEVSMKCAGNLTAVVNGSATITLELIDGNLQRAICPVFGPAVRFQGNFFFPKLSKTTFNFKGPAHPNYKATQRHTHSTSVE